MGFEIEYLSNSPAPIDFFNLLFPPSISLNLTDFKSDELIVISLDASIISDFETKFLSKFTFCNSLNWIDWYSNSPGFVVLSFNVWAISCSSNFFIDIVSPKLFFYSTINYNYICFIFVFLFRNKFIIVRFFHS